jgi:hypothetical protein
MTVIEGITRAVERAVEGAVTHLQSTPIVETFRGEVVWEGVVEEFAVESPPPKIVYGWAVDADPEPQYIAVLETDRINSPLMAVRAWIMSQARK